MDKSYGINNQSKVTSKEEEYLEEFKINGFTIINDVLSEKELNATRLKLDELNIFQTKEFSLENLTKINELNMVRCPFLYDDYFLQIATQPVIASLVKLILGEYYILHLQNGVINMPHEEHHQRSWHRDLPYQNFEISNPLAVSALFCIDEFSESTGGTIVLPFSHHIEQLPSNTFIEKNKKQVCAKAGSVILFDSMLLHKAGNNNSSRARRGINNMFVKPILKQQINIPKALNGKFSDDPFLSKFLGYESMVPDSVVEWRNGRLNKMKK
jgi:ectoine hydroxylase-related dioxygenase (phytanoyl-CoA dioxygenase family)